MNRLKFRILKTIILLNLGITLKAQINISDTYTEGAFPLVKDKKSAIICIDSSDYKVVSLVSEAFSNDINLISGIKPVISTKSEALPEYPVIIGTIGKSNLLHQLIQNKKLRVDSIKDKWESFLICTIDRPVKGVKKALIIAGSDRRGTAFGVFELSRLLGISPWIWWADVSPKHQDNIYLKLRQIIQGPPSVQYRGIFLNDEDWGLKPWASKNLDTDIQDIGPKTYAKIFELMLRLKANYIWPAMHDCTKAFYYYSKNPEIADQYAIVIGSSHCEPILRNNVFEWKENFKNEYGMEPGEWRYDLNKSQILKYWDDRAKQSSKYESVYTVGMRGIHDGSMPGPKDMKEKLKLLDTIIKDQRSILSEETGKPASQIPQIFCPYKEVLTLYQQGLKLPEDVTIVWADDNHGYIRQLSSPSEQKRQGGSGVYYHLSYWGSPHDYLWLSSISPSLVSYELTKAFDYNARKLWIINVGDIKPAELELEFTMDLAWNVKKWEPQYVTEYIRDWAGRTFGKEFADSIADIKRIYYLLAQNGKPEHLGLLSFSENEMQNRLDLYAQIAAKSDRIYRNMPERLKDAFFELIYYPVNGAAFMNQKIFYARKSLCDAKNKNNDALLYARKSEEAFNEIKQLTLKYNEKIANGKWNSMMSWNPRKLEVFNMPKTATSENITVNDSLNCNFNSNLNVMNINPSNYTVKYERKGQQVYTYKNLGITDNAIGILPINESPVSKDSIYTSSYVEYRTLIKPGYHYIAVKCLPTHPMYKGRDVRYGISVNNDSIQQISVNATAESAKWKINVLRGYSAGQSLHNIATNGESVIRIYLPEPGIIINRIEIE